MPIKEAKKRKKGEQAYAYSSLYFSSHLPFVFLHFFLWI